MPERSGTKPIQDLREWLARVEELGELIRVGQAVDCEEEMSAISYLVAKQQPSPAVLFERSSGFEESPYGAEHLWNILGPSIRRVAVTLEEPADTPAVELIRRLKDRLKRRIPPREVSRSEAPVYEHSITGDKTPLRFESAHQRLQGAPPPAGVFQAHHAEKGNLRHGGAALERAGVAWESPGRPGVRSAEQSHLPRSRGLRA